ncbi:dynein heavy chain 8 axonemal [Clonorchis sinensis]|uniref:Dynein heavy chain 8 axonemal n=2 Tax=Clonorchis sinensis TaxID=79923 RepID=G7Y918_CLOSI|nr:dynein heavy chain 8 axonemal [Clonorchis sinensis]
MDHLKPLHIFLKQEIDRMQKVITIVRTTLTDLKLAIDGTIVMSENLRDALDSLFDARIPSTWRRISWESATLGFWFTDLLDRNAQFSSWLFQGRPISYWMTGFFNPQGFLTAMRQEVARANKYALDDVELTNEVTKLLREEVAKRPVEGVYVHGLWLDGAGWDRKLARLVEPAPKLLYTALPVVHVSAYSRSAGNKSKATTVYSCPVYKKPKRTDLNYIFPLALNSSVDPDHWILRGVALLCDVK